MIGNPHIRSCLRKILRRLCNTLCVAMKKCSTNVLGMCRALLGIMTTATTATTVMVEIEPDVPACVDGAPEHRWRDVPSVYPRRAGAVWHADCVRCGCRRTTDTYAQDPETGRQGLTSVSYSVDGDGCGSGNGRREE